MQGLINLQDGMVLRQVQDDLEGEGFEVQCFLIPASGIGAWHQRNRVWIIGHSKHNGLLASEKRMQGTKKLMEGQRKGRTKPSNLRNKWIQKRWQYIKGHESQVMRNIFDQRNNHFQQIRQVSTRERDQQTTETTSRRGTETTTESNSENVSNTISELSDGCSSTTRDSGAEQIHQVGV